MNSVLRTQFDLGTWTFYPVEAALLACISIEEASLLYRERAATDPGRMKFEDAYRSLPASLPYNVYFGEIYPDPQVGVTDPITGGGQYSNTQEPFPIADLIVNVNVVIRMRTPILYGLPLTSLAMSVSAPGFKSDVNPLSSSLWA